MNATRIGPPDDRPPGDLPREVDVAVVGFGGAGACAAIEARRLGASVLVIERFQGGGSTARCGGVIYLGGGTRPQKEAGFDDDPEQMLRYLRHEVGDAVDEATLRAFCELSPARFEWLEELGISLPPTQEAPVKASYPPDACTLYFSGNEGGHPYRESARPAPRGHRVEGKGLTGRILFARLRDAALGSGAELRTHARARQLLTNGQGGVTGVEALCLPEPTLAARAHALLARIADATVLAGPGPSGVLRRAVERLESRRGRVLRVRARGGVILCAGGFGANAEMMQRYARSYAGCMPLGTIGDDGSGIRLGQRVGGAVGEMGRCSTWRFVNPPEAFTEGVLVDGRGERICSEELYGGTLGERIIDHHGGRAFLVIDAAMARRAREQIRAPGVAGFQKLTAHVNLALNCRKAGSLDELASRCGMPVGALRNTIQAYNAAARGERPDPFGKSRHLLVPLETPPFRAIDLGVRNARFPTPCMSLGGLVVEGRTGQVLGEDGSPVPGLFAAGRNAVGVSSRSYVSGLSVADCVFSGRNAGRSAAVRAREKTAPSPGRIDDP